MKRAGAAEVVALARSIFERELALSLPIVPKGQEHKEETMYDVLHLSNDKTQWVRFALYRPLSDARGIARAVSRYGAVWIKPHEWEVGVIPVGAA